MAKWVYTSTALFSPIDASHIDSFFNRSQESEASGITTYANVSDYTGDGTKSC